MYTYLNIIRMLWCLLVARPQNQLLGNDNVTGSLVCCPISFLASTGTIGYTSASTAVHRFAAFHLVSIRETALWIPANAHLCNMFHFFVFPIQAGAGNARSKEFDKCVIIGADRQFLNFWQINCCLCV
jgi:hypothetical protein